MKIKPCVVGLGYVGLPALIKLSKKFNTCGFDISEKRIKTLKNKIDINQDFSKKDLSKIKTSYLTSNINKIKNCNFFIVCVPTPITKSKKPDLLPLSSACKNLAKILKKKDIVVFESTVYPGITEDHCIKIIEKNCNLKYENGDFVICYSPERINPGDKKHTIEKINKLIAVPQKKYDSTIKKIYKNLSKKLIITRSIKETETSKVIENIQRDLNIALMNEIFIFCKKLNLNFYNVLSQANTKWNFSKYLPGLVGGHCLPVDPYYFSFVAKKNNFDANVTLSGRGTNEYMKKFITNQIYYELKKNKISLNKDKIIFAGLTYKKNVSDIRNSHSLKIFEHFEKLYKKIYFTDPFINLEKIKNKQIKVNQIIKEKNLKCLILLVDHDSFKNIIRKINKKILVINLFNFYEKNY